MRRYLDPKNIPKTPSQEVLGRLGQRPVGHGSLSLLSNANLKILNSLDRRARYYMWAITVNNGENSKGYIPHMLHAGNIYQAISPWMWPFFTFHVGKYSKTWSIWVPCEANWLNQIGILQFHKFSRITPRVQGSIWYTWAFLMNERTGYDGPVYLTLHNATFVSIHPVRKKNHPLPERKVS